MLASLLASFDKQSVTAIFQLPEEQRQGVIRAYIEALEYVFVFCVPTAVLAGVAAVFVKNWNVKQRGAAAAGGAI